jgi:hypothetical protein
MSRDEKVFKSYSTSQVRHCTVKKNIGVKSAGTKWFLETDHGLAAVILSSATNISTLNPNAKHNDAS